MRTIKRREFLQFAVTATTAASFAAPSIAQAVPHIVVVGGGFAGATAARYLKLWGGANIAVTLIDRNPGHYSCIMSNLVLNQSRQLADLHFGYSRLANIGVNVIQDDVIDLDIAQQRLQVGSGDWIGYERVVLAPGIEFSGPSGWNSQLMPHAWIAGQSTQLLTDQLNEIPAGGTFIMTIPPAPYRCPPGPYERACLVADFMMTRNPSNPGTVVVLDANPQIMAEHETFSAAFAGIYADIIDYHTGVTINSVEGTSGEISSSIGQLTGDVVNIIPPHHAPSLILDNSLSTGGSFADVDPLTYASTVTGAETVHIIGDSQATGQPKSGHMANAQAKICADAIVRLVNNQAVDSVERKANVTTNSACFSPITASEASWLTAVYAYDDLSGQMQLSGNSLGEAGTWNTENFSDMLVWSEALFADTFGVNARETPPIIAPPQATQVPLPFWAVSGLGGGLILAALRHRLGKR